MLQLARNNPIKVAVAAGLVGILLGGWHWIHSQHQQPLRLGLLHAMSGSMAEFEKPTVEAELLAVEEINAAGGIDGRMIETIIGDTASDPETAALKAEELMEKGHVVTIIGCHTSDCRKSVKPVIESHQGLFLYPMAYEGLELSENIIYTGATPNQTILPAFNWSLEHLGKRVYLIGSDYIWPHSINAIMRDHAIAVGGDIVGEDYIAVGSEAVIEQVNKIIAAQPDVIISSVLGPSAPPFAEALKKKAAGGKEIPVVELYITEVELATRSSDNLAGKYTAWSYFESIDRPQNMAFIERFRKRFGKDRAVNDVMQTAYSTLQIWARAVEAANNTEPTEIGRAMLGLSHNAPEGIISIDPATHHAWRSFNMGIIGNDRKIQIIWSAGKPIRPVPFPRSRSPKAWHDFEEILYKGWHNHWANQSGQPH